MGEPREKKIPNIGPKKGSRWVLTWKGKKRTFE